MGFEWQLKDIFIKDEQKIIESLQQEFEPFAVTESGGIRIWFKKHVFIDRDPKATESEVTE